MQRTGHQAAPPTDLNTVKRVNAGCPYHCVGYVCVDLVPLEEGVVRGDALEYLESLPDGSLDEIRAENFLDHLPNPQVFLDLAFRKLREGGVLRLVVDNAEWLPFYFPYFRNRFGVGAHSSNRYVQHYEERRGVPVDGVWPPSPSVHYSIFTKLHLENRLRLAGFTWIRVKRIKLGARLQAEARRATPRLGSNGFKRWLEQYVKFGVVGAGGALINWGTLYYLAHYHHVWYMYAEAAATLVAFTFNFYFNKRWTFGDN